MNTKNLFISRSSSQQKNSTAQQSNSTDCLENETGDAEVNRIIENLNEACDAEVDGMPVYDGDRAEPDCSADSEQSKTDFATSSSQSLSCSPR